MTPLSGPTPIVDAVISRGYDTLGEASKALEDKARDLERLLAEAVGALEDALWVMQNGAPTPHSIAKVKAALARIKAAKEQI